ncbi:hypothetical protein [Mycolicibacterium austroafricanum]|uniref:hypothetical protein n=1 Tax=Mycolicibacterium austroafricanum TaxID=39687 RepID=UPI001ABF5B33|nr:hypothetical protein [Mycolicibacterium austroafricanum]QRZ04515.1 hypothetical protein JN090_15905 [Mycolicibacterium austroafricanum]
MTVEQIVVVCDEPSHARSKIADIETFAWDGSRWKPTRVEQVAGYLFSPSPKNTAQPSHPAMSQGDYDGMEEDVDQLHYKCKLCRLDLDVRKSVLFPVLDRIAEAGVSHTTLKALIRVISKST